VLRRLPLHDVVPPQIAALGPVDLLAGALDDDDVPDPVGAAQGVVHGRLER
jgi:hypothetical protein